MRNRLVLCCLAGGAFVYCQESQTPARQADICKIEGRVVNAATGDAARRVTLALSRVDGSGKAVQVSSDSNGRFVFEGLGPGGYQLSAERAGFFSRQAYGAHRNPASGLVLPCSAGQEIKDLVFKLTPDAAVSGRVLDEDGDPVQAIVYALKNGYEHGRSRLVRAGTATTDSTGRYEISGLRAGKYILAAVPRPSGLTSEAVSGGPPPKMLERRVMVTYYPGAPNASGAAPINVEMGADLRVDIPLLKGDTVRVRGKVAAPPGMEGRISLQLSPRWTDRGSSQLTASSTASAQPDGRFEFSGIRPGQYLLNAVAGSGLRAAMYVEVSDQHIENLEVPLGPGAQLAGAVVPAGSASVRVMLDPMDGGSGVGRPSASSDASGNFTLEPVLAARYWVDFGGIPENTYLASARFGNQDLIEDGLDLSAGMAGRVVISLGVAAQVDGVVQTEGGQPQTGATVALIPVSGRFSQYKSATTDEMGAFSLKEVAPGDYKLLAWDDLEPDAYRDLEFVKQFADHAISVFLRENDRQNVTLKAISLDKSVGAAEER